jgi:DNA (cytosine-5)-methyltransferase 1
MESRVSERDRALHGDFTTIKENDYAVIDLLVGGTPCQAFSVAGLRKGFADERGNLTLEFVRLAQRLKPQWLVWENVPGVLSIDGGRAFGSFLGGLAECGYGFAYRILDAQHFGVPQRRRRVFVIGYLGDWRPPAAVFFERESLLGDLTPSRKKGEKPAPTISARTKGGGGLGTDFDLDGGLIASALTARYQKGVDSDCTDTLVAYALRGDGFDASEDGTGRGIPLVPVAFPERLSGTQCIRAENISPALGAANPTAVAFDLRGREGGAMLEGPHETANIRAASGGSSRSYVALPMQVRRLTTRECERLQGFPDDYTLVPNRGKTAADGPRFKALGNSMAVPCMAWLGHRIEIIRKFQHITEAA